jgi:hypothetical protein
MVEKWLLNQSQNPSTCLLVSVNPFINYQYEIVFGFLQREGWFERGSRLLKCDQCI